MVPFDRLGMVSY